tara:strand:- start:300 stop:644 length:345 start_codon:yes stop_codon:yes gene_type:complete
VSFLKYVISVWVIANILFIPSFMSTGIVPSHAQNICFIHITDDLNNDELDQDKLNLKTHCENCNFFYDNDPSFNKSQYFNLTDKLASNPIIINIHHYDEKNNELITTRAPPTTT